MFFIFLLFLSVSYCQADSEFKLQESFTDKWDNNCISKTDCFYSAFISTDDDINDLYYILYYSHGNENWQAIDSIDPSGFYNSTLYSFQNEITNSYIVLWKYESEYNPFFYTYYINEGKILKIGEWGISVLAIEYYCEYCDYSIEDIRIHQKDDEIEFSFLKNMDFLNFSEDRYRDDWTWTSYQAGDLILSFNIIDGTLKRIER